MILPSVQNRKTLFTRMCIGEAVITLLKDVSLQKLKILDVVRKAGVSRMTFYKYYGSSQDALEDYLHIIISQYLEECCREEDLDAFLSYEHILDAFCFFDRYHTFFLTMKAQGLYSVLLDSVNAFVLKYLPFREEISLYKAYAYAGSLLNSFMMWEEGGRKDRVEDVAQTLSRLFSRSGE